MQYRVSAWALGLLLIVGVAGCLPSEPEGNQANEELFNEATPGQLVEEFTLMARAPEKYTEDFRRHIIAEKLASMGPKTLSPLIELMAAADSTGETRLFTLQCIAGLLTPAYMAELTPLLDSEDPVIRACAVTLIGHIEHVNVMPLLRKARDDPDGRVSFSALASMGVQGDAEARDQLSRMFSDPEAKEIRKNEVLRVLLRSPVEKDIGIFTAAINEPFVPLSTRILIAATLGRMGDASNIEALEHSVGVQNDPSYTRAVEAAVDAIRKREGPETSGR